MTLTIDPSRWVRASTAATLIGIKRQAIYYHIRNHHLELLEIDGMQFVRVDDLSSLKTRPQARHG